MDLKEGDLVITLKKVENIRAIMGQLKEGEIGVISEANANFDRLKVYGVAIGNKIYYLFEDEIKKLEEEC
tara:strand:- start:730 stop:939 length:210 start_codon:yes stop_codon:yes gene_type:complete